MTQIGCKCGYQISDTSDALSYKYRLICDADSEALIDDLLKAASGDDPYLQVSAVYDDAGFDVYSCPNCRRLLLFEPGSNTTTAAYAKE